MSAPAELAAFQYEFEPYGPDHLADVLPFPAAVQDVILGDLASSVADSYIDYLESEIRPSLQGQLLFESDYLRANRLPDGTFNRVAEAEVRQNLKTSLGEAEVHSLVMESEHQIDEATGYAMGFGKTKLQITMEGRDRIHVESATTLEERQALADEYERSDIEVDDEIDAHANIAKLQAGKVKLVVSPAPTSNEMDPVIAKNMFDYDGRTILTARSASADGRSEHITAISIFGVSTEVWGKVLRKMGVTVGDNPSAKDIKRTHSQNYFDPSKADLLKFVEMAADELEGEERAEVRRQVQEIRENQVALQEGAEYYVDEWLEHTKELANSRDAGIATPKIQRFIDAFYQGQDSLLSADLRLVVDRHRLPDGSYQMSKALAELVEVMKRNTLWIRAGTKLGNRKTLEKLDEAVVEEIVAQETHLQVAAYSGHDAADLQNAINYLVARQNVDAGGGCAGGTCDVFGGSKLDANGNVISASSSGGGGGELKEGELVTCPDCGVMQKLQKIGIDGKDFFLCRNPRCGKKVAA